MILMLRFWVEELNNAWVKGLILECNFWAMLSRSCDYKQIRFTKKASKAFNKMELEN